MLFSLQLRARAEDRSCSSYCRYSTFMLSMSSSISRLKYSFSRIEYSFNTLILGIVVLVHGQEEIAVL